MSLTLKFKGLVSPNFELNAISETIQREFKLPGNLISYNPVELSITIKNTRPEILNKIHNTASRKWSSNYLGAGFD